jgi:hypothetical protein
MVLCAQRVLEQATKGMTEHEITAFNQTVQKMTDNLSR